MRRLWVLGIIFSFVFSLPSAWAQKTVRLSIATGGTGGVYYPLGGGMANVSIQIHSLCRGYRRSYNRLCG